MEISLHHPADASAYQVQKLDKVPPAYAHLKVPVTNEMRLIEGDFGFVFSQFNQIKDNGIYKFDLKLKKGMYFRLNIDKPVDALFMCLKNSFFMHLPALSSASLIEGTMTQIPFKAGDYYFHCKSGVYEWACVTFREGLAERILHNDPMYLAKLMGNMGMA